MRGYPIVGDFDGDGKVDLATYQVNPVNKFFFDLGANGYGQVDATIDAASQFGFIGVRARPVAADMDRDGIDRRRPLGAGPQRGHRRPHRRMVLPDLRISRDAERAGTVDTLNHQFSPTPLGHDLFARFGNEFAMPIVGNFDPPVGRPKGGAGDLQRRDRPHRPEAGHHLDPRRRRRDRLDEHRPRRQGRAASTDRMARRRTPTMPARLPG